MATQKRRLQMTSISLDEVEEPHLLNEGDLLVAQNWRRLTGRRCYSMRTIWQSISVLYLIRLQGFPTRSLLPRVLLDVCSIRSMSEQVAETCDGGGQPSVQRATQIFAKSKSPCRRWRCRRRSWRRSRATRKSSTAPAPSSTTTAPTSPSTPTGRWWSWASISRRRAEALRPKPSRGSG